MASRQRNQVASTSGLVEAREAFVAADPNAPTGEWVVREGTIWQADHPAVTGWPDYFVALGLGQVTPRYFPEREPS